MRKIFYGKPRGKSFELDKKLELADWQVVEVRATIVEPARSRGEVILRTVGLPAEDAERDDIVEKIHLELKDGKP